MDHGDVERSMSRHPFSKLERDFILDIARQVPVAIWAASGAEQNYAIRLWTPGAEQMYGIPRSKALGANYIELFVNEYERTQAIEDHAKLIATRQPYRNLARDKIAGKDAVILTQGFPLWHPDLEEWMQAEIAIDVTDVPGEEAEWLSKVRELAFRERETAARMQLVERLKEAAIAVASMGRDEGALEPVLTLVADAIREVVDKSARSRIWYEDSEGIQRLLESSDTLIYEHQYDERLVVDWVLRSREAVFVDYLSNQAPTASQGVSRVRGAVSFPRPSFPDGVRAPFAAFPILTGDRAVGVLLVYLEEGYEFRREVMEGLKLFAEQSALGISTAGLISDLQKQNALIAEQQERETRSRLADDYMHALTKHAGVLNWVCQLVRERMTEITDSPAFLEDCLEQIESVSKGIIVTGTSLARALEPEEFDVSTVLEGLANAAYLRHPEVKIVRELVPSVVHGILPFVAGAFENLIFNATDAIEQRGRIGILMRRRARSRSRPPSVVVEICDDGPGISEDILDRIWESGFSTKGAGHGYGLSRARQVFAQAGGGIEYVARKRGWKGACLRVSLPIQR
jgi:signal transduction histidine kinase